MRRILSILAAGTLALSACSDDTVGPPVNYVFVVIPDSAQLSMSQDDSVTMNAIVEDTISGGRMYNADLDWSSDDPDVAVAEKNDDGDWQIRATGDGQTQIHIVFNAYHGPVEGTIDVSVTGVPAATFTLSASAASLYPGDADTLRIQIKDADGNELGQQVTPLDRVGIGLGSCRDPAGQHRGEPLDAVVDQRFVDEAEGEPAARTRSTYVPGSETAAHRTGHIAHDVPGTAIAHRKR